MNENIGNSIENPVEQLRDIVIVKKDIDSSSREMVKKLKKNKGGGISSSCYTGF